jgi:hypothetical protein
VTGGNSWVEAIAAATASEPEQVTLRTVRLVVEHDGNPEDLAAALMTDEV